MRKYIRPPERRQRGQAMTKAEKRITGTGALLAAVGGCCVMSEGIWMYIAGAVILAGLGMIGIGTRRRQYE